MEDNKFTRMQQLAGLITESEVKEATPEIVAPAVDLNNTPDEDLLQQAIDANSTLKNKLKNIGSVSELDGFFKTIISYTSIDTSKSTILASLKKALDDISAEPTVSTKED